MDQEVKGLGANGQSFEDQARLGPYCTRYPLGAHRDPQQDAAIARFGAPGDFFDWGLHHLDWGPIGAKQHQTGFEQRGNPSQLANLLQTSKFGLGPRAHRDPLQQRVERSLGVTGKPERRMAS
jgi:hypothetical protein